MTSTMKALQRFFEATGKARVNSVLLSMGREKTEELGYSYEALRDGVSAWPWRKTPQNRAKEIETQSHVRELKTFTDRQLTDIGVARHGIEQAVRYGRPGIDHDQDAA